MFEGKPSVLVWVAFEEEGNKLISNTSKMTLDPWHFSERKQSKEAEF